MQFIYAVIEAVIHVMVQIVVRASWESLGKLLRTNTAHAQETGRRYRRRRRVVSRAT